MRNLSHFDMLIVMYTVHVDYLRGETERERERGIQSDKRAERERGMLLDIYIDEWTCIKRNGLWMDGWMDYILYCKICGDI